MKTTIWMSGILLALGGCGTHNPVPTPKSIPITPSVEENQSVNPTPFCCSLPQDLDLKLPVYGPKVNDLERFVQSITPYVEANALDRDSYHEAQKNFESRYFSPWGYATPPQKLQEITWPLRAFRGGYGSNLQPVPPVWFEQMKQNSNFEAFGLLNRKAIAIKPMDVRALPTDKPLYKNPSIPGEGYPFDLLQNSSVHFNEPLFVSHTSQDGAWSYIFSNNVSGWVKSEGITYIDDQNALRFQKGEKLYLIQDNIPLYDPNKKFVTYSRVGMLLPYERSDNEYYYALSIGEGNVTKTLSIPKEIGRIGISRFNKNDLAIIGTQMLKNTYGWGGMYGERDCSSMIRDYMTPFGIWLPRNSSAQAKRGEVISLNGLSNEEKLARIKTQGIPFETILYLKGHVLLYIGTYQESVLTLHNIWGIRTIDKEGNKGRHVIGKAVISTLELGSELENFDPSMKLLNRIESMNIFTKTPATLSRVTKNTTPKKSI